MIICNSAVRRELRSNIGITPLLVAVTKHSPPVRQPDSADKIPLTLLSNVNSKMVKVTPHSKGQVGLRLPNSTEITALPFLIQWKCQEQVIADCCSNRCTKESHFVRYFSLNTGQDNDHKCNCDSACNHVFADCCSDFATQCSKYR